MSLDAASIMTQPVVATRPESTVAEVANLLAAKGINAVRSATVMATCSV